MKGRMAACLEKETGLHTRIFARIYLFGINIYIYWGSARDCGSRSVKRSLS